MVSSFWRTPRTKRSHSSKGRDGVRGTLIAAHGAGDDRLFHQSYKRADLLLHEPERLRQVGSRTGQLQVVYAGKAHPHDEDGKKLIERIFQVRASLRREVKISYLSNYEMSLARRIVAGVDLWLNTPQPPSRPRERVA